MFVQRVQKQPSFNFCTALCRAIEKRYFKQRYGASYSQQTRCIPYMIYEVIDKDIFTMESLILAQDER